MPEMLSSKRSQNETPGRGLSLPSITGNGKGTSCSLKDFRGLLVLILVFVFCEAVSQLELSEYLR